LNPGHCGYEPKEADSSDSDLDRGSKDNQEVEKHKCEAFERIGHFYELVWSIKLIRNWYRAHLRRFGIRRKWKGKGFIALDGLLLVNQIMSLKL